MFCALVRHFFSWLWWGNSRAEERLNLLDVLQQLYGLTDLLSGCHCGRLSLQRKVIRIRNMRERLYVTLLFCFGANGRNGFLGRGNLLLLLHFSRFFPLKPKDFGNFSTTRTSDSCSLGFGKSLTISRVTELWVVKLTSSDVSLALAVEVSCKDFLKDDQRLSGTLWADLLRSITSVVDGCLVVVLTDPRDPRNTSSYLLGLFLFI